MDCPHKSGKSMVKLDLKMIVLYIVDFFFVRMFHLTQIQDDSLSLSIYIHTYTYIHIHTHTSASILYVFRKVTDNDGHISPVEAWVLCTWKNPREARWRCKANVWPIIFLEEHPQQKSKPKSLQNNGFNGAFMSKLALQNLVISGEMGCAAPSGAKTYEISGGLQARGARMPGSQPSKIGDLTNSELA
jgi:hypothetical protein